MKIQLSILIGAAFGLTLPEIPDLPDLVGFVENSVHGNFTAQTVEEPQELFPTIAKIRAMTDLIVYIGLFVFFWRCFCLLLSWGPSSWSGEQN